MSYDDVRRRMHAALERALGPEAAADVMEHLPPAGWSDLARTSDVDAVRVELRAEIGSLRSELKGDIARLEGSIARLEGRVMRSQFTAAATASGLVVSAAGVAAAIVTVL